MWCCIDAFQLKSFYVMWVCSILLCDCVLNITTLGVVYGSVSPYRDRSAAVDVVRSVQGTVKFNICEFKVNLTVKQNVKWPGHLTVKSQTLAPPAVLPPRHRRGGL